MAEDIASRPTSLDAAAARFLPHRRWLDPMRSGRVREEAGLVTTQKVGRVRTGTLGPRRLEEERAWIERYRQLWATRFDELDKIIEGLERKEQVDWTQGTSVRPPR